MCILCIVSYTYLSDCPFIFLSGCIFCLSLSFLIYVNNFAPEDSLSLFLYSSNSIKTAVRIRIRSEGGSGSGYYLAGSTNLVITPVCKKMVSYPLAMVLIFDGPSEHDTHLWTSTRTLICLRHCLYQQSLKYLLFKLSPGFITINLLYFFIQAQHVLSYHLI